MAAETLNFGPEWLRALSGGASLPSPPPSPALPRLRSAAKRYGREEMLALYVPGDKAPEEIQEFAAIAQEEPLPPLALLPLTEEEQRNFSQSVNSVAVLRLMGRAGGGSAAGGGRGRVGTRSRGRGRAEGGFFPRGAEEPEGFGRGREVTRSQSWDDRGERRFEKPPRRDGGRAPFEESGAGGGPRKEPPRSDSTNWRALREEPGGDDELGAGGGNWRLGPPPRPHRDPHGREGERWRGSSPDPPRWRRRAEAEPRGDDERRWTRDGNEDGDRNGDRNRNRNRDGDRDGDVSERDALPEWCLDDEDEEMGTFDASGAFLPCKKGPRDPPPEDPDPAVTPSGDATPEPPQGTPTAPPQDPPPEAQPTPEPPPTITEPDPPAPPTGSQALPPPSDAEDEEGMKHLQQEAEKLVASLQEDERFGGGSSLRPPSQALPLAHEAARKWFYRDPQGDIQGPFTPQEMGEWFHAGYFPMALMVKRGCDEGFQPLGDVIKMWGRVPFAPGPSPPPLMGNLDQERLKKQQELAATALYHQLQHQQFLQLLGRQPPAPCPAPPSQKTPSLGELTPQQLAAFLQALKPRTGEQNLLRSLALPDGASLWDGSNPPGADPGLWELPLSSPPPQSPILEQLQLQHKLQELRARRDEDDQRKRRRQEEELRRKQCRQQEALLKLLQQSGASPGGNPPPPWALPKAPPDGERPPPHKHTRGLRAVGGSLGGPWGAELLWTHQEKNPGTAPWEESAPGGGVLRGGGGKGRSGTAMGDPPFRRRRTEEEEKSKALRLWCEAALVALGAPEGTSFPFPLAEPEPPREGLGWARAPPQGGGGGGGGGGDPPPNFSRPPLMERMGRAPGPPPHSTQEQWLGAAALHPPQFGPGPKLPPPEAKAKRRPLLLHNDPSILGYALHCPGGEVEMVEDF